MKTSLADAMSSNFLAASHVIPSSAPRELLYLDSCFSVTRPTGQQDAAQDAAGLVPLGTRDCLIYEQPSVNFVSRYETHTTLIL